MLNRKGRQGFMNVKGQRLFRKSMDRPADILQKAGYPVKIKQKEKWKTWHI